MQGSQKVIDLLNRQLAGELAARDQYFIHSKMYEDWGYSRLHQRIEHEMQDETGHAGMLIARILFLGGLPQMQPAPLKVGGGVREMLQNDLSVEYLMVKQLREAIVVCEAEQDFVSRSLFLQLLDDTEDDHAHWLEQQLRLIDALGEQNYLQSQVHLPG